MSDHPATWEGLWEMVKNSPAPPSDPTKARGSSLPYRKYCTQMENGPAGDPATRGRALHYCVEHNWIPFDIPREEEEEFKRAMEALNSMFEDGWQYHYETGGREVFLQNDEQTVNCDLILEHPQFNSIAYVDWKFGMKEVDVTSPQLVGGIKLIMEHFPDYKHYLTGVIQPFTMQWSNSILMKEWYYDETCDIMREVLREKTKMHSACAYCVKWVDGRCPVYKSTLDSVKELK